MARLLVELLGESHPYISASLFPPPVLFDVLALDLDVPVLSSVSSLPGERVLAETDGLCCRLPLSVPFSFKARGTPSHLVFTFGTVGGSFADDTPSMPTAVARPLCVCAFLRIWFW